MHNRVIINMADIPDSVKDQNNNPAFWLGLFNDDKTKRQLDGYKVDENENVIQPPTLVHPNAVLLYWCRFEQNPQAVVDNIINNSTQMKTSEYFSLRNNPDSEWYIAPEDDN